ncbi:rRNA maturation RNase YbeY [Acuticoccus sp. M5D2P5]|uniref:rRNA maturation RNase YbeY n=1 Tax=Acuticoccus kalidii TaxID=2910977 RepID=UPI001F2BCB8B|nr:rRNA maturation RNase YbeY [Acuticoccus kalidii]MCF3936418.1 rRNA maturation RNase YbeY [Acuticoccus kalidii]
MTPTLDEDVTAGPASLPASVRVDDERWSTSDPIGLADVVLTALSASSVAPAFPASADILFTSNDVMADLNARYRGKDGPTNVLAFPSGEAPMAGVPLSLGGIALGFERAEQEARERAIPLTHHATHLTLHGMLHLLGFDHEDEAERVEMERVEINILGGLGIPNPYEGS